VWYWAQAIQSIGALLSGLLGEHIRDLHKQLEIAAVTLVRHRRYSVISTAGLVLAFTCCLLLSLYIGHELSFDGYHKNSDRIFRVIAGYQNLMPGLLAPTLEDENPHVERAARVLFPPRMVFRVARDDHVELTRSVLFGDSGVFEVFDWRFKDRIRGRLLDDSLAVVITKSAASRFFKSADPIGKTININSRDFAVTGVVQDIPANSHFRFDFMADLTSSVALGAFWGEDGDVNNWYDVTSTAAYVLLDDERHADAVAGRADQLLVEREIAFDSDVTLQSLKDIHLGRPGFYRVGVYYGDPRGLAGAGMAVLLLLIVAGINVVNLAVAGWRSETEDWKPTVTGGGRWALFKRFGSEAFLITGVALTLALLLSKLLLPLFGNLTNTEPTVTVGFVPWIVLGAILFVAAISAVATIFPSAFVSTDRGPRKPSTILSEYTGTRFRSVSISFQFVMATALVMSAAVMWKQVTFMQNKPLGYNPANLVVLPVQNAAARIDSVYELKNALIEHSGIVAASASNTAPSRLILADYYRRPESDKERDVLLCQMGIDRDFLATYDMKLLAGAQGAAEGENAYLIGYMAAEALGWSDAEDAVGKTIHATRNDSTVAYTVSGVFEDYHHSPVCAEIIPGIAEVGPRVSPDYLTLRVLPDRRDDVEAFVEKEWKRFLPGVAFTPIVLEHQVTAAYDDDRRIASQFLILAAVVLVVACAGLLGLATYAMDSRRDDIRAWQKRGLGTMRIVVHLSERFGYMLAFSLAIGTAIACVAVTRWLDAFPYHIALSPGLLVTCGGAIVVLGISLVLFPAVGSVFSERRSTVFSHNIL
jgi:putative ABC transport system permease protein